MSALFKALAVDSPTRSSHFDNVSRLHQKITGSCNDEFYARSLRHCQDPHCAALLGPLDGIPDEPKTVAEMYAEEQKRCPVEPSEFA